MNNQATSSIVVGISGSRASVDALRWAVQEARQRGLHVHAVLAWHQQQAAAYAVRAPRADHRELEDAARRLLSAGLVSAFGTEPPDDVSAEVTEGIPERILADRSLGAELLVLGSESAREESGRPIGPVIRGCLGHAHCPVVIVSPQGQAGGAPGGADPDHAGARKAHVHAA